jgi:DNA-binding MarR family transcriptional regulator
MINWQRIIDLLPAIRRTARSRAYAIRADPEEYEDDMLAGIVEAAAKDPHFLNTNVGWVCTKGVYAARRQYHRERSRLFYHDGADCEWSDIARKGSQWFDEDAALTRVIVSTLSPELQRLADLLASGAYTVSGNHTGPGDHPSLSRLAQELGISTSTVTYRIQQLRRALSPQPQPTTAPPLNHPQIWPDLTPAQAATLTYAISRNGAGVTVNLIRDHFNIGPSPAARRVKALCSKGALQKSSTTAHGKAVYHTTLDYHN